MQDSATTATDLFVAFKAVWVLLAITGRTPAAQDGEYTRVNQLVELGQIQSGDLFLTRQKNLMLALSPTELVRMPVAHCYFSRHTWLATTKLPVDGDFEVSRTQPDSRFTYDPAKAVAVARKFQDKVLPYGWGTCNKSHYWEYFLYGKTRSSRRKPDCPLRKPLNGITAQQIETQERFPFWNNAKRDTFPNDYTPYYELSLSPSNSGMLETSKGCGFSKICC